MCRIREISVRLGQDKGKISPGWRSGKIRVGVNNQAQDKENLSRVCSG
jgi:hypothetical protein